MVLLRPFSATTIAPAPTVKDDKKRDEIIKISRSKYAHPVKAVEGEINRWAGGMDVNNAQSSSDISNPQSFSKASYKSNAPRASDSTKLYDVKCSNCGKDTKVIFEPTSGRPVYCKNCLKKIKAGEIQPAPSPSDREVSKMPEQKTGQVGKRSGDSAALGDLGIEFGPSPSSRKASEREEKIETISFSSSNRRQSEHKKPEKQIKRREVNLSELRHALEESLEIKKEPEKDREVADKNVGGLEDKVKSSKEELAERIEEEKYEDETMVVGNPAESQKTNVVEPKNKKEIIKPGETVKF